MLYYRYMLFRKRSRGRHVKQVWVCFFGVPTTQGQHELKHHHQTRVICIRCNHVSSNM